MLALFLAALLQPLPRWLVPRGLPSRAAALLVVLDAVVLVLGGLDVARSGLAVQLGGLWSSLDLGGAGARPARPAAGGPPGGDAARPALRLVMSRPR